MCVCVFLYYMCVLVYLKKDLMPVPTYIDNSKLIEWNLPNIVGYKRFWHQYTFLHDKKRNRDSQIAGYNQFISTKILILIWSFCRPVRVGFPKDLDFGPILVDLNIELKLLFLIFFTINQLCFNLKLVRVGYINPLHPSLFRSNLLQ